MISILEWQQQWGYTFSKLLLDRKSAVQSPKGDLFESMLGIRGVFPGNVGIFNDSTINLRILDAVSSYLPKQGIVGINLLISVTASDKPEGQCWINNVESPAAIKQVLKLDWPVADSGYMAKYYYILDQREGGVRKEDSKQRR